MKHILLILLVVTAPLHAQQGPRDLHSYFSPKGGCTQAVVDVLNSAKKSVRVQAYSFTSAPIARALVDAKKRGIDVQVIGTGLQNLSDWFDSSTQLHFYESVAAMLPRAFPSNRLFTKIKLGR